MTKIKSILAQPGIVVILETLRRKRKWVALAFISLICSVFVQGITLGVLYSGVQTVLGDDATLLQYLEYLPRLHDRVTQFSKFQLLIAVVATAVVAQFIQSATYYLSGVSSAILSAEVEFYIRKKLFDQIFSFSFAQSAKYKVGDLVQHVDQAALGVQSIVGGVMWALIHFSFTAIYTIVALVLSPLLFIVTIVVGIAFVYVQRSLLPRLGKTSVSFTLANVDVMEHVTESIQAMRLIHSFAAFSTITKQLTQKQFQLTQFRKHYAFLSQLPNPLTQLMGILALGTIVIGYVYTTEDISNPDNIAELFVFLFSINRLTTHLQLVTASIATVVENYGRIVRLNQVLDDGDKEFRANSGTRQVDMATGIEFQSVNLQYTADAAPAVEDISFTLPVGSVTALVGSSGAGKSTIADLIIGLFSPTAGKISVDSVALTDIDVEYWRNQLSVVSQDSFLFNTTIAENIRFGSASITAETVKQAAHQANANEFIEQLPEQYETVIGERGFTLSGGQRQRIALARALARDSRLLILDEATSALDSESEKLIQDAIEVARAERTVLIIAHRLSTVVDADQILVLDGGKLVERGTHQDLMARNEKYAYFWKLQSEASH